MLELEGQVAEKGGGTVAGGIFVEPNYVDECAFVGGGCEGGDVEETVGCVVVAQAVPDDEREGRLEVAWGWS